MIRKHHILGLVFIGLVLGAGCKQKDPEIIYTGEPVDTLAFTDSEKGLIYNGPADSTMYVMNYFVYADSLVLRTPSRNVNLNDTATLFALISRMKATMIAEGGVGIAAPQVGINRNVIWVKRMDKTGKPFECYLNPRIVLYSNKQVTFAGDGCLSVPGMNANTQRYSAVVVEYDLPDGTHHVELIEGYTVSNFTAIIFQHEIDHLLGIIFLDRA